MNRRNNKILVFSAHPDDAELGMGATISLMKQKGIRVRVTDLTDGEPTPEGDTVTRKKENACAARVLGFERQTLDYKNRELVFDIKKRDRIASIIREYRPDTVFTHFPRDTHPDHREAARIVEDAVFAARLTKSGIRGKPFRVEKVYYYFAVHLKKIVVPEFFVPVSGKNHAEKMKALQCYRSQFIDNKNNLKILENIEIRDRYWGSLVNSDFAEGFGARQALSIDLF
jgi:bacillithiol biosynthesis deacetylase BshB1